MFAVLSKSLIDVFSAPLRGILWRSIGLTVLVLAVVVGCLVSFANWLIDYSGLLATYPTLEIVFTILSGMGFSLLALYVLPSASMLVAGFFLDEVASIIERQGGRVITAGKGLSTTSSMIEALRFFGVAIGLNLFALFFIFVPVVNVAVYFAINAYLFGREYFYLVAGRRADRETIDRAYREARRDMILAGFIIAIFALIPVINLLTPLFATVFMVHMSDRSQI